MEEINTRQLFFFGTNETNVLSRVKPNWQELTSFCLDGKNSGGISGLFLRSVPTYVKLTFFSSLINSKEENQLSPMTFRFVFIMGATNFRTLRKHRKLLWISVCGFPCINKRIYQVMSYRIT